MDMKESPATISDNRPGSSRYLIVIATLLIALTAIVVFIVHKKNQSSLTSGKDAMESKTAGKEGAEHHDEAGEHEELN
jgi:hypothetical protein